MAACWRGRPLRSRGLIEVRGLGIRRLAFEPVAVVGSWSISPRTTPSDCPLPAGETVISGISLPRLAVASGIDPLPAVLALLGTTTVCDIKPE